MGKVYSSLDDGCRAFIATQRVFFVATAPGGDGGHINCSPKGLDTFRVLDDHTVAYLDRVGSGVETIAHLRDNGRIVVMFCSFEGPPRILRLYGRGRVAVPGTREFGALRDQFQDIGDLGVRSIIVVEVSRIADACGYGVPIYEYRGERDQLDRWAQRKGADGLEHYSREKNARSIDGLPGLPTKE